MSSGVPCICLNSSHLSVTPELLQLLNSFSLLQLLTPVSCIHPFASSTMCFMGWPPQLLVPAGTKPTLA